MSAKAKGEGFLKVPLPFGEAISRALKVKPPPEGWKEYERAKARANRRGPKPAPEELTTDEEQGKEH